MHVASPSEQTKSLVFSHSSQITANGNNGRFLLINSKLALALNASAANAPNVFVVEAHVKDVPKATGEAWGFLTPIYWNNTNSNFTTTSAGNTLCGYATAAALSGDTVGEIFFNSINP